MPARYSDLNRQRVIVTAAGSGIGRTIAESFAAAGASVHVCDIDDERLREVEQSCPEIGTTVADVADPRQVDVLFDEATSRLGGLDVLVNNAGIAGPAGPIESLDAEEWERTIQVNLIGQFHCLKRAVPILKQRQRGCIVNISSTAGLFGHPFRTPYAASKWGVVGLTKSLAMELGPHGIRVNAICPGAVEGERIEKVIEIEAAARDENAASVREAFLKRTSLRTFIARQDVANLVLFVCSEQGARISGQALAVDGSTESMSW